MNNLAVWKERGKIAALFTLCVLMAAAAAQVTIQPKLLSRGAGAALAPVLQESTGTLQDIHASTGTIKSLLAEIKTDYENNQENVAANSEAIASTLHEVNAMVKDSRIQLFGGPWNCKDSGRKTPGGSKVYDCDQIPGLFPQTSLLLADAHSWMTQLQKDTHELMVEGKAVLESTNEDVKELKNELIKLGKLEDDLDQAVRDGSKEALAIAGKVETSIDHVNTLLSDPKIESSMAGLNKSAYHLGEIAETTDIATRGLRRKVGQVKWVINQLTNLLKATLRLN